MAWRGDWRRLGLRQVVRELVSECGEAALIGMNLLYDNVFSLLECTWKIIINNGGQVFNGTGHAVMLLNNRFVNTQVNYFKFTGFCSHYRSNSSTFHQDLLFLWHQDITLGNAHN